MHTAWKVCKYGAFSGPYFPAFGLIMDQKKNPYLDTFDAVTLLIILNKEERKMKQIVYWIKWFLIMISITAEANMNKFSDTKAKSSVLLQGNIS